MNFTYPDKVRVAADLCHRRVTSDQTSEECCGLGDRDRGIHIVLLVNNGATLPASLRGLLEILSGSKYGLPMKKAVTPPGG